MSKTKTIVGVFLVLLTGGWVLVIPFIGLKGYVNRLNQERQVEAVFLAEVEEEIVLLFWGYMGCYSACPVSLSVLNDVYNRYTSQYSEYPLNVSFVGIPIPGEKNTQSGVERYAQRFNKNFRGYSLSGEALGSSLREFGVAFSPSTLNPKDLNHSAFVYLLQSVDGQWILRRTYTQYPPQADLILKDLYSLRRGEQILNSADDVDQVQQNN